MYKQQHQNAVNGGNEPTFLLPKSTTEETLTPVPTLDADVVKDEGKLGGSKDGTTTPAEIVPEPASPELVIAPDNDCYDGAL